MNIGDRVKLRVNGMEGRIYTLLEVNTHDEGTKHECQWTVLQPPAPDTHLAHWPIEQVEAIKEG